MDPTGKFGYLNQDLAGVALFGIRPEDGAPLDLQATIAPDAEHLQVEPSGRFLYAASDAGVSVFDIDPVTGQLTAGPSVDVPSTAIAITSVLQ